MNEKDISIDWSDERHLTLKSFGAKIENGALALPPELRDFLGVEPISGAASFYSVVERFPGAVQQTLGWKPQDYETAKQELRALLRGHVEDTTLGPAPARPPAVGVFIPSDRKARKFKS